VMHEVSYLWFNHFWPSILSNGPEALVQTVVYGIIAVVFVPPVRRWFLGHFRSVKAHAAAESQALHAKLDHIIKHHPAIPPFPAQAPPASAAADSTPAESPATPDPTPPAAS